MSVADDRMAEGWFPIVGRVFAHDTVDAASHRQRDSTAARVHFPLSNENQPGRFDLANNSQSRAALHAGAGLCALFVDRPSPATAPRQLRR
jgi:hypothetical protein